MSEERIIRYSLDPARKPDLKAIRDLTDEQIAAAVRDDQDAAPLLDESWFAEARIVMPPGKTPISLRVDNDVLAYFKEQDGAYQTRMNAVLRAYMEHERKKRPA